MKEQKLFLIISVSIDFMEGGTQESRQALSAPGTQTSLGTQVGGKSTRYIKFMDMNV